MTVWRVEVSLDVIVPILPAPDYYAMEFNAGGWAAASYGLTAENMVPDGISQQLYVKLHMMHQRQEEADILNPIDAYLTRMTCGEQNPAGGVLYFSPDPWIGTGFQGDFHQDWLDGGSRFGSHGTLAIEKDTVTGAVRFISPAVTLSSDASGLGIYQDSELRPAGIGILLQSQVASATSRPELSPQSLEVGFSNIYGKQDGTTISGAAMTITDPGMWDVWMGSRLYFIGDNVFTSSQQALYEDAVLEHIAIPPGSGGLFVSDTANAWFRAFQGADQMPSPLPLDLMVYEPTNTLIGGWARMPHNLTTRRSQDARMWTDSVLQMGKDTHSLSLALFGGQLWACYHDGTNIVTQNSFDFAATWSAPMPVSISGTNPRLVISPEGMQFYFYISGASLLLQRSFDGGATLFDATPITVATPVTAQDFGAVYTVERVLVVAYIDTGNWVTRLSRDAGVTWQTQ
jgi:hypothetical protein